MGGKGFGLVFSLRDWLGFDLRVAFFWGLDWRVRSLVCCWREFEDSVGFRKFWVWGEVLGVIASFFIGGLVFFFGEVYLGF